MFALRRNEVKTRGQLLREELNETVDHAMRAAGHAAGGLGAVVGPKVTAARATVVPTVRDAAGRGWGTTVAVFTPLTEAAQTKVAQTRAGTKAAQGKAATKVARAKAAAKSGRRAGRRKKAAATARRRWPVVAGLLVSGVLAGAVAAAVLRRRRQWADHQLGQTAEPSGRLDRFGPEQPPAQSQAGPEAAATASQQLSEPVATSDNRHQ